MKIAIYKNEDKNILSQKKLHIFLLEQNNKQEIRRCEHQKRNGNEEEIYIQFIKEIC